MTIRSICLTNYSLSIAGALLSVLSHFHFLIFLYGDFVDDHIEAQERARRTEPIGAAAHPGPRAAPGECSPYFRLLFLNIEQFLSIHAMRAISAISAFSRRCIDAAWNATTRWWMRWIE